MEIPYQKLNSEILQSLIEEFVTREGTDYGETEVPLQIKVKQVKKQLQDGTAAICFDDTTKTCNIIEKKTLYCKHISKF
ncbi:MAG: YheU family protein [bacterium]|nr:YheU family protein [bacterium]